MTAPPGNFATLRRRVHDDTKHRLGNLFGLYARDGWGGDIGAGFADTAVDLVAAGVNVLVALTDARTAAVLSSLTGRPVAPAGLDPTRVNAALRGGIDRHQVYARPWATARAAIADDREAEAEHLAEVRLAEIAEADLQAAYAIAADDAIRESEAADQVTGWQRVLKGPTSCALCVIASTRSYRVGDLSPIHPGCDCEVHALTEAHPYVLDRDQLDAAYAAAEALTGDADTKRRRADLRRLALDVVADHGELGRVLVNPRHAFTGPADIPAATG